MANRSSNVAAVPEAKGALDRFKMEVASELGVPLTDGYNGNLTSKTERIRRWLYGQKNDRSTGATDVRRSRKRHERKRQCTVLIGNF